MADEYHLARGTWKWELRHPSGRKEVVPELRTVEMMQARAAGDMALFDDSVAQLRSYFDVLEQQAAAEMKQKKSKPKRKGSK